MSAETYTGEDVTEQEDIRKLRRMMLGRLASRFSDPLQATLDTETLLDGSDEDIALYGWSAKQLENALRLKARYLERVYPKKRRLPPAQPNRVEAEPGSALLVGQPTEELAFETVELEEATQGSLQSDTVVETRLENVVDFKPPHSVPSVLRQKTGESTARKSKAKLTTRGKSKHTHETKQSLESTTSSDALLELIQADIALDEIIKAKYESKRKVKDSDSTGDAQPDLDGRFETKDTVGVYLQEIGKVALLNAVQEVGLAKRIEAGLYAGKVLEAAASGISTDNIESKTLTASQRRELQLVVRQGEEARTHMLEANLRLVANLAKRYTGRGMPYLDLMQEGNLGLIRAVEKFDYTKGFKFSTYATWWIRQAITRGMADQGRTIRLPVHLVEKVNKLTRIKREMHQDLGRGATDEELAAESGIPEDKIQDFLSHSTDPVSLDMPVGSDEDAPLGDFIEDTSEASVENAVLSMHLGDAVRFVVTTLDEREQQIVRLRFGLDDGQPRTLDQIGKLFDLSRERVRQIEREVMTKLRNGERADRLRDYAG